MKEINDLDSGRAAQSDQLVVKETSLLKDVVVEYIAAGSISAVMSVKNIRELRRWGAKVKPLLSKGASQFITQEALSWAAGSPCRTHDFSDSPVDQSGGSEANTDHLCGGDILVVAPASANFIAKVAHGICDTRETALFLSYAGAKRSILLFPAMHESMFEADIVQRNLATLAAIPHVAIITSQVAEHKYKLAEPVDVCFETCRQLHLRRKSPYAAALISFGRSRAMIDPIRYITNFSSGALGTALCERAYAEGLTCFPIAGDCEVTPRPTGLKSRMRKASTNQAMKASWLSCLKEADKLGPSIMIFAASLNDFRVNQTADQKLKSSEALNLELVPDEKILSQVYSRHPESLRIACKLLSGDLDQGLTTGLKDGFFQQYMSKNKLDLLVCNTIDDVMTGQHRAVLLRFQDNEILVDKTCSSRQEIVDGLFYFIHDKSLRSL